jgi:hypothetical protein
VKKRPEWYEGSFCAPDLAEYEPPREPVDVERLQIKNLRTGIGDALFEWMEEE